ncbi:MAG: c-type cytochrome [Acidobacteriota bacterium]
MPTRPIVTRPRFSPAPVLLLGLLSSAPLLAREAAVARWVAPDPQKAVANPVASSTESIARGQALYRKYCLTCHGEKGLGDGPVAKRLGFSAGNLADTQRMGRQTDGELAWKIANGRDPMPGFQKKMALTDQQIWDLVNFTRHLARAPRSDARGE